MFMNLLCIEIYYKDFDSQKSFLFVFYIIIKYWWRMCINICLLKFNYNFLNY